MPLCTIPTTCGALVRGEGAGSEGPPLEVDGGRKMLSAVRSCCLKLKKEETILQSVGRVLV